MNKKRLDINRFEYHDNVSVDFTQDTQKKETIIYYDYYLYNTNTEIETIGKPVRLIIKGWTKIAAYDENNAFLCHLESCNYFIHEVLNMEQHDSRSRTSANGCVGRGTGCIVPARKRLCHSGT